MTERVTFTYDGANIVTATITGATIGRSYQIDIGGSVVFATASSSTLVLASTAVSATVGQSFLVLVDDHLTPHEIRGLTVFTRGIYSPELTFGAEWSYDGGTVVSVTFVGAAGVQYRVEAYGSYAGIGDWVVATGAIQTLSATVAATADGSDAFYAALGTPSTAKANGSITSSRIFDDAAGAGRPGNPTGLLDETTPDTLVAPPEAAGPTIATVIPVQSVPLPSDQALAAYEASLDPSLTTNDLLITSAPAPSLGRGVAIDFDNGMFQRGAGGDGVLETRDLATLRTWIQKALLTARGAHPIYTPDYGVESPHELFGGPIEQFPVDEAEERWTAAVLKHPRITSVSDFEVDTETEADQEAVLVEMTVVLDNGAQVPVAGIVVGV